MSWKKRCENFFIADKEKFNENNDIFMRGGTNMLGQPSSLYEQTVYGLQEKYCYAVDEPDHLKDGIAYLKDCLASGKRIDPLRLYDTMDILYNWDRHQPFNDLGIEGKMVKFFGLDRADDPDQRNASYFNSSQFHADFDTALEGHPVIQAYNKAHGFDDSLIRARTALGEELGINPYRYNNPHEFSKSATGIAQKSSPESPTAHYHYDERFTNANRLRASIWLDQGRLRSYAERTLKFYESACEQLSILKNGEALKPVVAECLQQAVEQHQERIRRQQSQARHKDNSTVLPEQHTGVVIDPEGVIDVKVGSERPLTTEQQELLYNLEQTALAMQGQENTLGLGAYEAFIHSSDLLNDPILQNKPDKPLDQRLAFAATNILVARETLAGYSKEK